MNDFKKDIRERKKEYAEKLKDPRWQKLRLKIFERDNWTCQSCGDKEATLNIHHRYYLKNKEPWDYPVEAFITLCDDCHSYERDMRQYTEDGLLFELRKKFLVGDLIELSSGFYYMPLTYPREIMAEVYSWAMWDTDIQKLLLKEFIKKFGETWKEKYKKRMNELVENI